MGTKGNVIRIQLDADLNADKTWNKLLRQVHAECRRLNWMSNPDAKFILGNLRKSLSVVSSTVFLKLERKAWLPSGIKNVVTINSDVVWSLELVNKDLLVELDISSK